METLLKRLLSIAVALVMVIGLMPWNATSVYATETEPESETTPEELAEGTSHSCTKCTDEVSSWIALTGAETEALTSGYYYLTADTTIGSYKAGMLNGVDVTICLNGHTLSGPSNYRMFDLTNGAKLTIVDCGEGGTLAPKKHMNRGTIASLAGGSQFTMLGGNIDGSAAKALGNTTDIATSNGGAFYVSGTSYVTIDGAAISNCKAIKNSDGTIGNGGLVYLSSGAVTIKNSTIINCTATADACNGGVVYAAGGTVRINNCNISGSFAYDGGVIYAANDTEVVVSIVGSSISGAIANHYGGAVYAAKNVDLSITNTQITGCKAQLGSAIAAFSGSPVTIDDSTITGNTATKAYSAVHIQGSTLTVSGNTKIHSNTSTEAKGTGVGLANAAASMKIGALGEDAQITLWKADKSAAISVAEEGVTVAKEKVVDAATGSSYVTNSQGIVVLCADHAYTESVTKDPTCVAVGEKTFTCAGCSDTYTENIEPTGEHIWVNGVCNVCETVNAKLSFYSISLQGNIAVNFYMTLSDAVLAGETAYMQFTMADGTVTKIPASEGTAVTTGGNTYYVFTASVAAKEMTDDIKAQIFFDGGSTKEYTYSVKQYADTILADTTGAYTQADKDMVTAMLQYGAAAQLHFDYNTDKPAAELFAANLDAVTAETLRAFASTGKQGTEAAPLYAASLILESKTTLRLFFNTTADITVTMGDTNLEVKERSGLKYVEIKKISAKDLDTSVTVTVSDGTATADVTYNPMTYCYNVLNAAEGTYDQEMIDAVKALYLYNQAANTYFA